MKLTNPFRNAYSLIPAFSVVTLVSVTVAFVAKVPQTRLVTVVIVPLTVGFVLSRLFGIVMSHWYHSQSEERSLALDKTAMPPGATLSLNLALLSAAVGIITTLSSLTYWGLGLKESAYHAVPIIFWCVIAFLVCFATSVVCAIYLVISERRMAIRHLEKIVALEVTRVWKVARSPQWLVQYMPGLRAS